MFYDRPDGLPRGWIAMMRDLVSLGPAILAGRMVRDYTEGPFLPAAATSRRLPATSFPASGSWPTGSAGPPRPGRASTVRRVENGIKGACSGRVPVRAFVELGDLDPSEVEVQVAYGRVDDADELPEVELATLEQAASEPPTAGPSRARSPSPPRARSATRSGSSPAMSASSPPPSSAWSPGPDWGPGPANGPLGAGVGAGPDQVWRVPTGAADLAGLGLQQDPEQEHDPGPVGAPGLGVALQPFAVGWLVEVVGDRRPTAQAGLVHGQMVGVAGPTEEHQLG